MKKTVQRQWLRDIRKGQGVTLVQLAEAIGTTHNYLSEIETGRRNPSGKLSFKIAEFLKFPMTYFYTEGKQEGETESA